MALLLMSLSTAPVQSRPQLPPLSVALSLLSESAAHRAELATLELAEARDHALVSTLLAAGTVAMALLTGFALTFLVAGMVWDSPYRVAWLAGLSGFDLAATTLTGAVLLKRLRTWRPLNETQNQLTEDFQCLNKIIKALSR